MFNLKLVATVALLFQAAFAVPAPVEADEPALAQLEKRGEGIHLFNCRPFGGAGVSQTWLSIVVYCANDADCSKLGYSPPSDNVCIKGQSGASETYHVWEGSSQSCTFPTGVTFSWNINSGAQSQPNYSSVGSGSNGFRSFAGFKDDHVNGLSYNYHSCVKIYYYI